MSTTQIHIQNLDTDYVPTMLSIQEVVDRTGISYSTIYRWAKSGVIKSTRAGTKYLIHWQRFLAFLEGE